MTMRCLETMTLIDATPDRCLTRPSDVIEPSITRPVVQILKRLAPSPMPMANIPNLSGTTKLNQDNARPRGRPARKNKRKCKDTQSPTKRQRQDPTMQTAISRHIADLAILNQRVYALEKRNAYLEVVVHNMDSRMTAIYSTLRQWSLGDRMRAIALLLQEQQQEQQEQQHQQHQKMVPAAAFKPGVFCNGINPTLI